MSVLRQQGNSETKMVTIDLSEPAALDMINGGNMAAIIADEAYAIGVTAARAAAASLLNRTVEPFLVVDALSIGPDNVSDGWKAAMNMDAPPSLISK